MDTMTDGRLRRATARQLRYIRVLTGKNYWRCDLTIGEAGEIIRKATDGRRQHENRATASTHQDSTCV